jgi:hypothetical protein
LDDIGGGEVSKLPNIFSMMTGPAVHISGTYIAGIGLWKVAQALCGT